MPTQSVALPSFETALRLRGLPWARDFSLVGAATGFAAPYLVVRDLEYATATAVGGAVSGALLGLLTARLLGGSARRWPKLAFLPLGALLGALWGGCAALATAFGPFANVMVLSLIFGCAAGAVQLGWFWLVYSYRRVNQRSTFAVVLLAVMFGCALGLAGFPALALLDSAGLF